MYIIFDIIYKFFSTNEKLHHAPNKPSFCLLGREGTKGVEFLLISICSPQRPNGSPNVPSNISQLSSICSTHLCPFGTYMSAQILGLLCLHLE